MKDKIHWEGRVNISKALNKGLQGIPDLYPVILLMTFFYKRKTLLLFEWLPQNLILYFIIE
jgi:hypothetical protein